MLGHAAKGQPSSNRVQIRCPQLSVEQAAAYEARVLAELAVRALPGEVRLECDPEGRLSWRGPGATASTELRFAAERLTADRLLEHTDLLFQRIIQEHTRPGGVPTPASDAPPAAEATPPVTQPAASAPNAPNAAGTPPSSAASAPAVNQPPANPAPVQGQAPRPAPDRLTQPANPGPANPGSGALPSRRAQAPLPKTEREVAQPVSPSDPLTQRFGLGLSAGTWQTQPNLGVQGFAAQQVERRLALALELSAQLAVPNPESYRVQVVQAELGAAWEFSPALFASASLGVQAAHVQGIDRNLQDQAFSTACASDASSAWCWSLAAKAALSWTPHWLPNPLGKHLRPWFGLQLGWVARELQIHEDTGAGASSQQFLLPSLRPSAVLGAAWLSSP